MVLRLIDIAESVRSARKAKKMTQGELAEKAGMSRSRIEAFETSRLRDMNFANVVSILNAVGLDLHVTAYNQRRPTLDGLRTELEAEDQQGRPAR